MEQIACLGFQQRKRKESMTPDSWSAVEARHDPKKKMMDSKSPRLKARYWYRHGKAQREAKRRVRADKRAYVNNLATRNGRDSCISTLLILFDSIHQDSL